MKTTVSFFSGGGGFDMGSMMAGFKPIAAYEYIKEIADVYRTNLGDHINVVSILDVAISTIPTADLYHFSPPCPNFSNAKKGGEETENDIKLSYKVCDIITEKRPLYVTLENVYGYRKSQSFKMIYNTLRDLGYSVDYWHLNAANYGVPQTRKRLILIARRDGKKATRPTPTHEKNPRPLFGLKKWVGWYEAIEDLIPTLEPSKFAPWQLRKLPKWFNWDETAVMEQTTAGDRPATMNRSGDPVGVLGTGKGGRVMRAFIANGTPNDHGRSMTSVLWDDPIFTTTATVYKRPLRAFIMNAANPNGNETRKFREQGEPMKTITSGDSTGIKGFIPHSHAGGGTEGVYGYQPSYTIASQKGPETAVIIPDGSGSNDQIIDGEHPAHTLRSGRSDTDRVITNGRVVKLNVRSLARLQSFPDWYIFPTRKKVKKITINNGLSIMDQVLEVESKTLSCTIIGNSVPPLLALAICKALL